MNKTTKYLGLVTILSIFTVALSSDYIDEAEALEDPYIEIFGISAMEEGMYKVVFTVYNPTNENIQRWLLLHVSSDTSHKEARSSWISANSYTYVPVLIHADDPSTITATLD